MMGMETLGVYYGDRIEWWILLGQNSGRHQSTKLIRDLINLLIFWNPTRLVSLDKLDILKMNQTTWFCPREILWVLSLLRWSPMTKLFWAVCFGGGFRITPTMEMLMRKCGFTTKVGRCSHHFQYFQSNPHRGAPQVLAITSWQLDGPGLETGEMNGFSTFKGYLIFAEDVGHWIWIDSQKWGMPTKYHCCPELLCFPWQIDPLKVMLYMLRDWICQNPMATVICFPRFGCPSHHLILLLEYTHCIQKFPHGISTQISPFWLVTMWDPRSPTRIAGKS